MSFAEPILDLRIFKQPAFDVAIVLQVAMSFVLFGTILLSPLFLQELLGYSAWQAGLTLTPRGLAAMFALLLMGQLSRTGINTGPLVGVGFAIASLGCWLTAGWNLQISAWTVIWTGAVMSVGYGLSFPILQRQHYPACQRTGLPTRPVCSTCCGIPVPQSALRS
jgi:DHA2 family multidrug resistance protein